MNSNSVIHFTDDQYTALRSTYRKWWANELPRPICPIVTGGHPSARKPSPYPTLCFATAWDLSISPEQLIDARDWELSTQRFHGEAFPMQEMSPFGPGAAAAFLGCTPVSAPNTVWFEPPRPDIPIEELHFEYDENNPWLRRVMNVYEAGLEKWGNRVVMGMTDLGGVMDILASFRGTENLLMDLYDDPDEVLRCVREIQAAWFVYYDKINAMLASAGVPGYSHWFRIYGEQPHYILQSDFSYMIGPDMFAKFVEPELRSSAARIHRAVYHLDGVGELPHLDQLLAIDDIHGIQWVPGDGPASEQDWSEVQMRIEDAGKKMLHWTQKPDGSLRDHVRNPGMAFLQWREYDASGLDEAKAYGAMHGVEVNV